MKRNIAYHKIIVLVPFRNSAAFIERCVASVLRQHYINYEVHLLDDASTDNSLNLISDDIKNVFKFRNRKRLGALGSLYEHLSRLELNDEDILAILDGDDELFGEYSLQVVNLKYNNDILLTYGQYVDNYGTIGHCSPYTLEEFKDIRNTPWKASHLKTFKYKLFSAYLRQDLSGRHFKDINGNYIMFAYDIALMIPLIEIAGFYKICFVNNIVYCYRLHANNDHATSEGLRLQQEAANFIMNNFKPLKQVF